MKRPVTGTRGKVVDRLRRAPQTVVELARSLGITGNAVRSHLSSLEGDGLVIQGGLRRTGARRPSLTYRLAPDADILFSKAYVPFLDQLLHVLAGALPAADLSGLIRTVGRRLARPNLSESLSARVVAAASLLEELGGIVEVGKRGNGGNGAFVIRGLSCPLGAVVRSHPKVCGAIESLVAEVTRARVRETCLQAGDQPQCRLEITHRPPGGRDKATVRPGNRP